MGPGKWALVSGPLGYGKSTLAGELVRSAGAPYAWVNVDARDDLPRFAQHFVAALAAIDEHAGAEAKLALETAASDEELGAAIANDVISLDGNGVIVID